MTDRSHDTARTSSVDPPSATTTPGPVVELEKVDVPALADPNTALVREVNWRIGDGEFWLLGGAPGSGKSSAVSVAAGLVRPLRGKQRLFGRDLVGLSEAEQIALRSKIGVVFGGGGRLFPQFSVAENLALPVRYHGRTGSGNGSMEKHVEHILSGLGLSQYARRLPRELPLRVAQRVALARALMLEPEVLILDDPLAGLASPEAHWWREYARQENALRPRTLVVATNDPRPWKDMPARLACVENQRLRFVNTVDDLCDCLELEKTGE